MRYFLLLLLVLTGTPAVGASGQATDPTTRYNLVNQAESALSSGDFDQAAMLFRQLAEQTPQNLELWRLAALATYRNGNAGEALEILTQLRESGYQLDDWWLYNGAILLAENGRQEEALTWLDHALKAGFASRVQLRTESAFTDYHSIPRFRELSGLPPEGLTRTEAWRFDLAHFVEEARRLHADSERPAHSLAFEEASQQLHDKIPELTDEEIVLALMRLAALLGDGHSVIYGPGEGTPLEMDGSALPVKFYLFEEGLFVVEAEETSRDLIGSRVLEIGSLTPDEVLTRLSAFRGVDNQMTMKWLGVQFYIRRQAMLRGVGATETDGTWLTVSTRTGTEDRVKLPGTDWQARRKLRSPATADTTLWLRHVDKSYWMTPLTDAMYFQFNQVRNQRDGTSLSEFAIALRDSLRASELHHLIVDVRHNNGGNNSLVRPLIRELIAWELADDNHQLWVLTGRNTFSAAQNFLNQVERYTDAIIVGEPSASSPNFVGEETNLELPWSRVNGSISTRYWQDSAPTDTRQWIYPDIPIQLSAADYFGNRDPVLDAVREIIRLSN